MVSGAVFSIDTRHTTMLPPPATLPESPFRNSKSGPSATVHSGMPSLHRASAKGAGLHSRCIHIHSGNCRSPARQSRQGRLWPPAASPPYFGLPAPICPPVQNPHSNRNCRFPCPQSGDILMCTPVFPFIGGCAHIAGEPLQLQVPLHRIGETAAHAGHANARFCLWRGFCRTRPAEVKRKG